MTASTGTLAAIGLRCQGRVRDKMPTEKKKSTTMHETYMRTAREDSRAARVLCVGRHGDAHVGRSFARGRRGFAGVEERNTGDCNVLPMFIYTENAPQSRHGWRDHSSTVATKSR